MIKFKDYNIGLRRLDLNRVLESTVYGPIYTFKVNGQEIIDGNIYEKGTRDHVLKKSEYKKRLKIRCARTKHYFTSLGAQILFIKSHQVDFKTPDWINKNCPLVMNKNKIIIWSL